MRPSSCAHFYSLLIVAKYPTTPLSNAPLDLRRADLGPSHDALAAALLFSMEGYLYYVVIHIRYCIDLIHQSSQELALLMRERNDKLRVMEHIQRGGPQLLLAKD
jgi:hypothetical protein